MKVLYGSSGLSFNPELYQEFGRDHLLENMCAALFAGMGLGKTSMTLDALNHLFDDCAIRAALIVAPVRVCNLTWPNEVEKWIDFSWMKVANLRTKEGIKAYKERKAHLFTCNYEMLPKLVKELFLPDLKRHGNLAFDVLVWDELSKAKNHSSKRIACMRRFWPVVDRHWGLTGTPAPNSQSDLFAQVRLLDNGERLGRSFHQFRGSYFYPTDYERRNWVLKSGQKERLEAKIADMTLVLNSSDYLDIPDTVVEDIEIQLPDAVKAQYKKFAKELFLLIEEDELEAVNAAVLVNKLIQCTSGAIYNADRRPVFLHDAKMKALAAVLKRRRGPILVTYQYQHERDRIKKAHPEAVLFSDAKGHKAQDELVKKWNAGKIPILVLSPQSAGHGLNMQDGGCEICWFSLPWSRELYDQMNARVARKGQLETPIIYRLLCPGTVDDDVAETLDSKAKEQTSLLMTLQNFRKTALLAA